MNIFTDDNFEEEVLSSEKVVVVDFWAQWCTPCHMLTPILQQLESDFGQKVKFGKLNVDENRLTATRYQIMNIPTVLIFKGGGEFSGLVGVQPKAIIAGEIKRALEKN